MFYLKKFFTQTPNLGEHVGRRGGEIGKLIDGYGIQNRRVNMIRIVNKDQSFRQRTCKYQSGCDLDME